MYHSRFKGIHYEAGQKYGDLLYKRGMKLSENRVINRTPETQAFGKQCAAICKDVYPEVLQEIEGISDGQHMPFDGLAALIFGIYCFASTNLCTCFAFRDDDTLLFGRNSDFFVSIEKQYDSCYYRLDNCHAFIGNTTAMVQMEDGVNERGLAVGLTFVCPTVLAPGLNAGLLVRYLLERCDSVANAIHALHTLPISSSQTLTLLDKSGDMAVVECNCEQIVEIRPQGDRHFVATANNFNSEQTRKFRVEGIDNWRTDERNQVAHETLLKADTYSLELAMDCFQGNTASCANMAAKMDMIRFGHPSMI